MNFSKRHKHSVGRLFCFFILVLILVHFTSCGSSSSSSSSGGSDSTDGDSGTGFRVTGTLSSTTITTTSLVKGLTTSSTITNILAVSPVMGDVTCKIISVEDDGSFDFRLGSGRPWFFYFYDSFKNGWDMYTGRFESSGMDTLLPISDTGSTDLGTVTVDGETGTATSDKDHDEIVSDLGIDSDTADTISEIDDIARRYSNPDADNNGEVDCGETDHSFLLDFHVRFNILVNGTNVEVNDMIDSYFDDSSTTVDYQNTGIYVAYLNSFSSEDTGSVTFVDSTVTTEEGGAIPANTATSDITTNNFSDYKGFGVNIANSSELPEGQIVFTFGDKALTFSDVATPSLSDLNTSSERIFPFVKFNKSDSSCTSSCTLSGISYKWMKKTDAGWTAATLEELDLIVSDGRIGFRVNGDENKVISFTFSKLILEETLTWNTSNANLEGATESEFNNLTTDQICHIGLSYDDQLGMRIFENIDNSNTDCAS